MIKKTIVKRGTYYYRIYFYNGVFKYAELSSFYHFKNFIEKAKRELKISIKEISKELKQYDTLDILSKLDTSDFFIDRYNFENMNCRYK